MDMATSIIAADVLAPHLSQGPRIPYSIPLGSSHATMRCCTSFASDTNQGWPGNSLLLLMLLSLRLLQGPHCQLVIHHYEEEQNYYDGVRLGMVLRKVTSTDSPSAAQLHEQWLTSV